MGNETLQMSQKKKGARGSVHAKVLGQEDLTICKVGKAGASEGDRKPYLPALHTRSGVALSSELPLEGFSGKRLMKFTQNGGSGAPPIPVDLMLCRGGNLPERESA